ncbi:hypothetical protein BDK51DRAFT_51944 [Blyttiomyces helicus]|uniref:Uncharacterized protein n=1 Tax=Blyttiomyces helicus TaxID=388810 RepID=A0A4P9WAU3_9FUNG|nr:hypothetical protein BDK51DRAFT_51944 [Blyttiomyces helicus]|eukprot:RKO88695.1 hypothetical protein BDK51DRAFT_51944 [Blyttiomyces helicus]
MPTVSARRALPIKNTTGTGQKARKPTNLSGVSSPPPPACQQSAPSVLCHLSSRYRGAGGSFGSCCMEGDEVVKGGRAAVAAARTRRRTLHEVRAPGRGVSMSVKYGRVRPFSSGEGPTHGREEATRTSAVVGESKCILLVDSMPLTEKRAWNGPGSPKWEGALNTQIRSMLKKGVFTLVKLPERMKAVGSKWARSVAKGYGQRKGIDFTEM